MTTAEDDLHERRLGLLRNWQRLAFQASALDDQTAAFNAEIAERRQRGEDVPEPIVITITAQKGTIK